VLSGKPALSFDETLAELLAFVGRRVAVTVSSARPLVMVAAYSGTLARGDGVQHESRAVEGEAFMFVMEEDYGTAFVLEERIFYGAHHLGGGSSEGVLEIHVGSAVLSIDVCEAAAL
jgi:hypothetical protein